jgi:hypothetical protein
MRLLPLGTDRDTATANFFQRILWAPTGLTVISGGSLEIIRHCLQITAESRGQRGNMEFFTVSDTLGPLIPGLSL